MKYEAMSKATLVDRIHELEAALESLKSVTRIDRAAAIAATLGLTGLEARFVSVLTTGRVLSVDAIIDAAYFDRPADRPDASVFRSRLGRIRSKLFPFGVSIKTHHGIGFQMLNPEVIDAAVEEKTKQGSIRVVESDIILRRDKTAKALEFLNSRRDRIGRAMASTQEIRAAIDLCGPVAPIMERLQRNDAIRILKRPTASAPRQSWVVAMPEISNV